MYLKQVWNALWKRTPRRRRLRPFAPRCERLESRSLLAGMGTVIIDETFEDGSIDGFDEVTAEGPNAHIATGDSYGVGNKAYQITYAHDEFGAYLSKYHLHVDSIELSFASKLPDGIPIDHVTRGWGGLKQSRLFRSSGAPTFHNLQDQFDFYNANYDGTGGPADYKYSTYVEYDDFVHRVPVDFRPDEWYHVRYYAKFNTPGRADGIWMLWFNGELQVDKRNVLWSESVENRIDGLWIGGNLSLGGDDPDRPFRRLIDDVKVIVDGDVPAGDGTANSIPALTIGDARVTEGHRGKTAAQFVVSLSQASTQEVVVNYATREGTASHQQDFRPITGVLRFPPGTISRTIYVSVAGDKRIEADEQFAVELSNPTHATIGRDRATGTIANDDVGKVPLRKAERVSRPSPGIVYAYFEGDWEQLPNFRGLTPVATGTMSNFDLTPRRDWSYGYEFTGYVRVPRNGLYTFGTTSDDGSRVWIGDTLVVDNDGLHAAQERNGSIGLKAGYHRIRVEFFERSGGDNLTVTVAGPGLATQQIPAAMLFRR